MRGLIIWGVAAGSMRAVFDCRVSSFASVLHELFRVLLHLGVMPRFARSRLCFIPHTIMSRVLMCVFMWSKTFVSSCVYAWGRARDCVQLCVDVTCFVFVSV